MSEGIPMPMYLENCIAFQTTFLNRGAAIRLCGEQIHEH